MTSPQQIEILDIRHFSAKQLRPLLDQEAAVWLRMLRWDYRTSTNLLLQYLDSRILPGFVALDQGRICGYTFCVYEGQKAVIGDLYTSSDHPHPLAVSHSLAQHMLETLGASPDITRIEAQLLLFDQGVLAPIFRSPDPKAPAFQAFPRLFLEHALQPLGPIRLGTPHPFPLPANLELCPWNPGFYQPAAELIHAAYLGHIDATINDQYRTLAGSLRFLHNIVRFPGCGTFDPQCSWVLREQFSNAIVAVLLCSRVAPDTAHITQLCVAPAFRARHLGSLLLDACMHRLRTQRYRYITLTVSAQNEAALRLYHAANFTLRHRFDALVLDKQPHRMHLV
jgi:ribosomal protein S18 acetylase RimI-like enzyme